MTDTTVADDQSLPRVLLDVPFPPFLHRLFEPHCELLSWSALGEGSGPLSDVAAILSFAHTPVGEPELARLPGIKVVSNYGVGVDHIDVAAATRRGIPVGNTPGTVDGATADQTMALMLAVARNTVRGDAFARGPDFHEFDPGFMLGTDVFGATLGIVGMGRIGREVARRARGFDMCICYYNRRRDSLAERELGVEYRALDSLLAESDFVSLNVPLTPQTSGLIDEARLRRMKSTAFLINTARGGVVDTAALERALREGWIAGAGLDVTEPEPLPRDHPILALRNVVITPHLGTSTLGTRTRMGRMALENLQAGLEGRALPYAVSA